MIGQTRSSKDDSMTAADVLRRQENLFHRNTSYWFRIRKKDNADVWLHMDGKTWTTDKNYLYLGTKKKVEALLAQSEMLSKSDDWIAVDVTRQVRGREVFIPPRYSK